MSITALINAAITVAESFSGSAAPFVSTGSNAISHNGLNQEITLPNDDVPATVFVGQTFTLTSGAASIDLTSLVGTNQKAVSASGLKLQNLLLVANSENGNPITIAPHATNGYACWGADFSLTFGPGGWALLGAIDDNPDVGGSAKVLALTGTGNTDSISAVMIFG